MSGTPRIITKNWFAYTGSIGLILAVPALGIWGYSFRHTQESSNVLVYIIILGVSLALLSIVLWGIFNALQWSGHIHQINDDVGEDIEDLKERISTIEYKLREQDLNQTSVEITVEGNELQPVNND
jgi:predicted PurR-regulated permease PerM